MVSIKLENLCGYWVVITPRQVYEFPSHALAKNFYTSLLKNLGEVPTDPLAPSLDAIDFPYNRYDSLV